MDLIEYMRFRWIPLAVLFVVGLVGIAAVGSGTLQRGYEASAKLTIRPAASQSSPSNFSLDRFITGEMATIYDPNELDAVLASTDVSRAELARGLSTKHKTGSDTVTLTVRLDNRNDALLLVNRVAARYVQQAKARAAAPLQEQRTALETQIKSLNRRLAKANRDIQDALAAFVRDNPTRGVPGADVLAPDASIQAGLLKSQLQQLGSDLVDVQQGEAQGNLSEVTTAAKSAARPKGWSLPVYLSAVLALLLALLAIASTGLLLSRRILSPSRWDAATAGSGLQSILPMWHRRRAAQQRDIKRALLSLQDAGEAESPTLVVYVPDRSHGLSRRVEPLLTAVEEQGITLHEAENLEEAWAQIRTPVPQGAHTGAAHPVPRILVVASRHRARIEDAAVLADRPGPHLDHVVPVLV